MDARVEADMRAARNVNASTATSYAPPLSSPPHYAALAPHETDLRRWRLCTTNKYGRQVWHYDGDYASDAFNPANAGAAAASKTKNADDDDDDDAPPSQDLLSRYFLNLRCPEFLDDGAGGRAFPPPAHSAGGGVGAQASAALANGWRMYAKLQTPEAGHWANDYGGPLFLMPGFVIMSYACGVEIGEAQRRELLRYELNQQRHDGGWGFHIEGESGMMGTALNYTTVRLLGLPAEHARARDARRWMRDNGGALLTAPWGKFWLALLGVYDWSGVAPVPPELWALPYAYNPLHPGRWWCHCRLVYLPMCYLYAQRFVARHSPLIDELRAELYEGLGDYSKLPWTSSQFAIDDKDVYHPPSLFCRTAFGALHYYEAAGAPLGWLRRRACARVLEIIRHEDRNSNYICIGPVNKPLNMMCEWHASDGRKSQAFLAHEHRLADYYWLSADGMKVGGENGSQFWDATFSLQALTEVPAAMRTRLRLHDTLARGWQFIDNAQIRRDPLERGADFYRDPSAGAWPFTTGEQNWPISDCTGEGLLTAVLFRFQLAPAGALTADGSPSTVVIPDDRLHAAVDIVLGMQNSDGGWPSYERERSGRWIEALNPAAIFGSIMVDYSYVECSSSCLRALLALRQHTSYRRADVDRAVSAALGYIMREQRDDGSWYGCWGVCFTYAIWFGVEALAAAQHHRVPGASSDFAAERRSVARACACLIDRQLADGGWSERYASCPSMRWIDGARGDVVQTAWALLALMTAGDPAHRGAVERGVVFLVRSQLASGDWPQQDTIGTFNYTCSISYSGFKNIFPLWALARFERYRERGAAGGDGDGGGGGGGGGGGADDDAATSSATSDASDEGKKKK